MAAAWAVLAVLGRATPDDRPGLRYMPRREAEYLELLARVREGLLRL